MIYRFLILSDEIDNFSREIEIDSSATFLDLNNAILDAVGYTNDLITSFFNCSHGWRKQEEITLIEMDTNPDVDSFVMDTTYLDEFTKDEGDKLIYVFDNFADRSFFVELKEINGGNLDRAKCTKKEGKAPKQLTSEDEFLLNPTATPQTDNIEIDYYGDDAYDLDDLDENGFSDIGLDELSEIY
ncbi:MAG: hypothetical protein R3Y59_01105 [bacterium]